MCTLPPASEPHVCRGVGWPGALSPYRELRAGQCLPLIKHSAPCKPGVEGGSTSARHRPCALQMSKYINCLSVQHSPFMASVSLAASFSFTALMVSQWLLWGQAVGRRGWRTEKGREGKGEGERERTITFANCLLLTVGRFVKGYHS